MQDICHSFRHRCPFEPKCFYYSYFYVYFGRFNWLNKSFVIVCWCSPSGIRTIGHSIKCHNNWVIVLLIECGHVRNGIPWTHSQPAIDYGCKSWTLKKNRWRKSERFWDEVSEIGPKGVMNSQKGKRMDTSDSGHRKVSTCLRKTKKTGILWTHSEKEPGFLEKDIIQDTTSGSRARGRPKTAWLGNVKNWTARPVSQLIRIVEDRDQWREVVHDASNPRPKEG